MINNKSLVLIRSIALGWLLLSGSGMAAEGDGMAYDRIAFSVNAEREVENDTAIADLYATEQGQDSKALSEKVNSAVSWALEEAKKVKDVEVRTLNYTTYPNYNQQGGISGWQVRQNLQLKSTNIKALSELVGVLQQKVRVEAINYEVSRTVQRDLEQQLTTEALGYFKQRADKIKQDMGRSEYRVVNLNINSLNQGGGQPPVMFAMAKMADAAAAPNLEDAGKQVLRVNVDAQIELSPH